jgi:heme oxygenase
MLTELLKEHTKQPHQELESIIISKIKQLDSRATYAHFLRVFYGYIAAIEQKLNSILSDELLADHNKRRKASLLLKDISELGHSAENVTLTSNIPQIHSAAQALGAMYVLEGSTLGGKYISKMIAGRLALDPETALSFFNGYKEQTEAMWAQFKDTLNSYPLKEASEAEVIEAANQTFMKFKDWINEH